MVGSSSSSFAAETEGLVKMREERGARILDLVEK